MDNQNKINDYEALVRRANKIVTEFDRFPLMPEGNFSVDFIKNVFNYNPLFVLDELRKYLLDTLLEVTQYRYSEEELQPIIDETYAKHEARHKARILKTLVENYKYDAQHFRYKHWSYMMLRPEETVIFYYAFSIYYIAKELKNGSALLFARQALKAIDLIHCEKGTNPIDGIKHTGKLLSLAEFAEDRAVYYDLLNMIEFEIENVADEEIKQKLYEIKKGENSSNGCYVATCVYGSYDCPEVWVLRRFRDNMLANNIFGRIFIKIYYTLSPTIVKRFGKKNWFVHTCKLVLDKMVSTLQTKGFNNTPYKDKF